jgi:amphiphysin
MADVKGGFTKAMQKHAGRAKEKLMQSLGKAEKTTDDTFDVYVNNFKKQETSANRLHKELKNYVTCLKALQVASKSLFETLEEVYEEEWVGKELLLGRSQTLELLWGDLCHKLNDQVVGPINIYQSQFPEVRRKVDKRGRKLVDFDSCRHNYEALQANKKRDDIKIVKAREQLDDARNLYEHLNKELYDELPALYDSRVPFFVSNLQSLFIAESIFHAETAKINSELSEILDKLAEDNQKGTYLTKRPQAYVARTTSVPSSPNGSPTSPTREQQSDGQYEEIEFHKDTEVGEPRTITLPNGESVDASKPPDGIPGSPVAPPSPHAVNASQESEGDENHVPSPLVAKKLEELYDMPTGATTENLPPGVLYKVRATYKYEHEDEDELSFDVGEIVEVIEFEDPEDQEDGWLYGIKETTGQKGLFPANFTRPI